MSTLEKAGKANQGEIRYLTPLDIATKNNKKYCMFKRSGIKYVDYKLSLIHISEPTRPY